MTRTDLKIIFGGIGGLLGMLFGELDSLMILLLASVVLDYLTGVIKAIHTKSLSSEIGFDGIMKKVFIFVIVALAHLLDTLLLDGSSALRSATCLFYVANEGISILENAAACDVKIPYKIVNVLKQLKENEEHD